MSSENTSGPGRMNRLVAQIILQEQQTGGGSEADLVANDIFVPCRCQIEKIWISAHAVSSGGTAQIMLLKGTAVASHTDVHSAVSLTPTGLSGSATPTDPGAIYEEGDQLCASENTTNTKTIDGLVITVVFRQLEQ